MDAMAKRARAASTPICEAARALGYALDDVVDAVGALERAGEQGEMLLGEVKVLSERLRALWLEAEAIAKPT